MHTPPGLPDELWAFIIKNVSDRRIMRSLCLVSKRLHRLTLPQLYQAPFDSQDTGVSPSRLRLCRTVCSNPYIVDLIRTYHDPAHLTSEDPAEYTLGIIPQLQNLTGASIYHAVNYFVKNSSATGLTWFSLQAIDSSYEPPDSAAISTFLQAQTQLTIFTINVSDLNLQGFPTDALPSLKHLSSLPETAPALLHDRPIRIFSGIGTWTEADLRGVAPSFTTALVEIAIASSYMIYLGPSAYSGKHVQRFKCAPCM